MENRGGDLKLYHKRIKPPFFKAVESPNARGILEVEPLKMSRSQAPSMSLRVPLFGRCMHGNYQRVAPQEVNI